MTIENIEERRRYERIKPNPAQWSIHYYQGAMKLIDISLGGARVHLNEPVRKSQLLDIEITLPDKSRIFCKATVAWVTQLPAWSPMGFDAGLQFSAIADSKRKHLAGILQVPCIF